MTAETQTKVLRLLSTERRKNFFLHRIRTTTTQTVSKTPWKQGKTILLSNFPYSYVLDSVSEIPIQTLIFFAITADTIRHII